MHKISYFCDKCGKELKGDDNMTLKIGRAWVHAQEYDLCAECAKPIEKTIGDLLPQTANQSN